MHITMDDTKCHIILFNFRRCDVLHDIILSWSKNNIIEFFRMINLILFRSIVERCNLTALGFNEIRVCLICKYSRFGRLPLFLSTHVNAEVLRCNNTWFNISAYQSLLLRNVIHKVHHLAHSVSFYFLTTRSDRLSFDKANFSTRKFHRINEGMIPFNTFKFSDITPIFTNDFLNLLVENLTD